MKTSFWSIAALSFALSAPFSNQYSQDEKAKGIIIYRASQYDKDEVAISKEYLVIEPNPAVVNFTGMDGRRDAIEARRYVTHIDYPDLKFATLRYPKEIEAFKEIGRKMMEATTKYPSSAAILAPEIEEMKGVANKLNQGIYLVRGQWEGAPNQPSPTTDSKPSTPSSNNSIGLDLTLANGTKFTQARNFSLASETEIKFIHSTGIDTAHFTSIDHKSLIKIGAQDERIGEAVKDFIQRYMSWVEREKAVKAELEKPFDRTPLHPSWVYSRFFERFTSSVLSPLNKYDKSALDYLRLIKESDLSNKEQVLETDLKSLASDYQNLALASQGFLPPSGSYPLYTENSTTEAKQIYLILPTEYKVEESTGVVSAELDSFGLSPFISEKTILFDLPLYSTNYSDDKNYRLISLGYRTGETVTVTKQNGFGAEFPIEKWIGKKYNLSLLNCPPLFLELPPDAYPSHEGPEIRVFHHFFVIKFTPTGYQLTRQTYEKRSLDDSTDEHELATYTIQGDFEFCDLVRFSKGAFDNGKFERIGRVGRGFVPDEFKDVETWVK